jgi:signal transduction histidine kinase
MADASAKALAELLLSGGSVQQIESVGAALAGDPPLALWTICAADHRDGFRPQGISAAAQWLAEHALAVLQWEAGASFDSPPADAPQGEVLADRVAAGLQVAHLAARLAAPAAEPVVQEAYLLGLLHDAKGWLPLRPGRGGPQRGAGCQPAENKADWQSAPPRWLTERNPSEPAVAAAALAARVISGEQALPGTLGIDLDAGRRLAAEGRNQWLATEAGLAGWLPSLAEKLARLETLETQFREAVETEKLEALAEFAAGAGHEINNPLTVIAGRAQLFLQEETDPERRRALALMNVQAMRVYEMIADMRLFARPPRPEPQRFDLAAMVDRLIADFEPRAARQETTLCREGPPGPIEIGADPTQLSVALRAMCQNALEAIGLGGHITIGVQRSDREVQISVCDDGPGITPEERRHVFDPFYSARQAGRGLGLGLSKCWRIVTNHGGRIEVQSEPGHGARFTIVLPQVVVSG